MLELYFAAFGIFQVFAGLAELIAPFRSFNLWKKWVFSRLFPVHGIILVAAGFPFIMYRNTLSGIIFWIGIFMALSGPFLLIYPEKVRDAFHTAEKEFRPKDLRIMVYIDAVIRFSAGAVVFAAVILKFSL